MYSECTALRVCDCESPDDSSLKVEFGTVEGLARDWNVPGLIPRKLSLSKLYGQD